MGNHATVIFRMRLSVFRNMPGFRDEASKVDFIACAHQLLEMGVSQQNALKAMNMIYRAFTEYHGSFEATWDAEYYLRDQGLEIEWVREFLDKARTLLIWVREENSALTVQVS